MVQGPEDPVVASVRSRFPDYKGPRVPIEASSWTERDLELFFKSGGSLKPRKQRTAPRTEAPCTGAPAPPKATVADLAREMRGAALACPLLGRLRLTLAEGRVSAAPLEHSRVAQLVRDGRVAARPPVAAVDEVARGERVPNPLVSAHVVGPLSSWRGLDWGLSFWASEAHRGQEVSCVSRFPSFLSDTSGSFQKVTATVAEFAQYVELLDRMDNQCSEDNALAYPRFVVGHWMPFADHLPARELWQKDWRGLSPPGISDSTERWVKMFSDVFKFDWERSMACFFHVQIAPAGTASRLYVQNNGAHSWYGQIEGERQFVLFSPADTPHLYARTGVPERGGEQPCMYSPVDVLKPDLSKHPAFRNARAQVVVLRPGEMLVVPKGWWTYSANLKTSVTLFRKYWDRTGRFGMYDEFHSRLNNTNLSPETQIQCAACFAELRARMEDDDGSDVDEH